MGGGFMLWQKSWWETRWGLLAFMGVMLLFAVWSLPLGQTELARWFSSLQEREPSWREGSRGLLPLLNSYQGYMWSNWFKLSLLIMWPTCAVTMEATLVAASSPWAPVAPVAAGRCTSTRAVPRRCA